MTEYPIGSREQNAWVEEQGGFKNLGTNTMADDGEIVGYNTIFTPDFDQNWQEILNNGGDTAEVKDMEQGALKLNFSLKFTPYNFSFIKYSTHPDVTNVDQTTYNEHVWTIDNPVKTFRYEWAKRMATNEVITLTGCTIKSWRFSWQKGTGPSDGFVTVEAECVASGFSKGTAITTIAYPTATAYRFFNQTFTYESGEVVEVNSGEIRCNNGINEDDSRYCNYTLDRELGEPICTLKRYGMTMNINPSDSSFFDDWANGAVLSGSNIIKLQVDTHNFISFQLNSMRLSTAPAGATNMQGVSPIDLVGVPLNLTITGEDGFSY